MVRVYERYLTLPHSEIPGCYLNGIPVWHTDTSVYEPVWFGAHCSIDIVRVETAVALFGSTVLLLSVVGLCSLPSPWSLCQFMNRERSDKNSFRFTALVNTSASCSESAELPPRTLINLVAPCDIASRTRWKRILIARVLRPVRL